MKHTSVFLLLLLSFFANGQQEYDYHWKKEALLLTSSALMVGGSMYLDSRQATPSLAEITSAVPSIGSFDKIALGYNSQGAENARDLLLYTTSALPIVLLSSQHLENERFQYVLMLGETVTLNAGLTFLVKSLTKRNRPYFYDDNVSTADRQNIDARKSFFSGHTSHTAAMTFFTASVFSDLYPASKWKPLVWAGAASIPAATALLSVRAGRHFPSDVLVGYAVGAGIGVLLPFLHRVKPQKNKSLSLAFSGNALALSYKL